MLYEYPDEFIVSVTYTDVFNGEYTENNELTNKDDDISISKYRKQNCENKIYKRKCCHKKNKCMLRMNNSKEDNIFDEFIDIGFIDDEDKKNYIVNDEMMSNIDNDYAKSEIKDR